VEQTPHTVTVLVLTVEEQTLHTVTQVAQVVVVIITTQVEVQVVLVIITTHQEAPLPLVVTFIL
jgi:hypothetical protein